MSLNNNNLKLRLIFPRYNIEIECSLDIKKIKIKKMKSA